MKKLTKNQKNALLIGGGALAILALSSFGKSNPHENPDFKIVAMDEANGLIQYTVNGMTRTVSAKGQSYFPLPGQDRNQAYGIATLSSSECVMQFLLRRNGQFIKELARIQLPPKACEKQIIIGGAASETV